MPDVLQAAETLEINPLQAVRDKIESVFCPAVVWKRFIKMLLQEENNHTPEVVKWAFHLGREMKLNKSELINVLLAAFAHDIGKVETDVWQQKDHLTEAQRNIMSKHPEDSARLIDLLYFFLRKERRENIKEGAGQHHERPDGMGYPRGLEGGEISQLGQILAVVDAYQAMGRKVCSGREGAMTEVERVHELMRCSGKQFNAEAVRAFARVLVKLGRVEEKDIFLVMDGKESEPSNEPPEPPPTQALYPESDPDSEPDRFVA